MTHVTRGGNRIHGRRPSHFLAAALAVAASFLAACDDGGPTDPPPPPPESRAIVSEPVVVGLSGSMTAAPGIDVSYVSLPPGTAPGGTEVELHNAASGFTERVRLINGGFDPVAVPASVDDTIRFRVFANAGLIDEWTEVVKPRRAPKVVRTDPPRGKRDVPLNGSVIVVFSEPVDRSTATSENIRVLRDGVAVDGTVALSGDGLVADFISAAAFAANTTYTLRVGTGVRDPGGDALESTVTADFTTGESQVELLKVGGDGQSAEVGTTIYVTVQVLAGGVPARTVAVSWSVTSGGGSIIAQQERTDTGGTATAAWTLGPEAGTQTAQASVPGAVGSPATFTATAVEPPEPPPAPEPIDFAMVSAGRGMSSVDGGEHTCGVATDGTAYCWGVNDYWQLGHNSSTGVGMNRPGRVRSDLSFASISAGVWGTCALTTEGAAYCWGWWPGSDELGDSLPTPVFEGYRLTSLENSAENVCGLTDAGTVLCYGDSPVASPDGGRFFWLSVSDETGVCALSRAGEDLPYEGPAYCWRVGEEPAAVGGGHAFYSLDGGGAHFCGLTLEGGAYCWGQNTSGQLGDGTTTSRTLPVLVSGGHAFAEISAGTWHTCGLVDPDGGGGASWEAYCWGGLRTDPTLVPTAVPGVMRDWWSISAGGVHTCAVAIAGEVGDEWFFRAYCWGGNRFGQLGDGTNTSSAVPVAVAGPYSPPPGN